MLAGTHNLSLPTGSWLGPGSWRDPVLAAGLCEPVVAADSDVTAPEEGWGRIATVRCHPGLSVESPSSGNLDTVSNGH